MYGADLSYAGLFAKHADAIQFFSVSQVMAEDLELGKLFKREFITRLEKCCQQRHIIAELVTFS